jgi:hypothetical protein
MRKWGSLSCFSCVELSLSYGRQSVDQFVLLSGSPLGIMTRFYPYPFFCDNCFVVFPVGRPLWWEDGSVNYSAISDWSGHWGPITIHYLLIWDRVPSSSPLTTHRDYGGGVLTRLHTGLVVLTYWFGSLCGEQNACFGGGGGVRGGPRGSLMMRLLRHPRLSEPDVTSRLSSGCHEHDV